MSRGVSGRLTLKETARLLALLVEHVPGIRQQAGLAADSCVDMSTLAVQAVREAGGRARPFPVRVQIKNELRRPPVLYRIGFEPKTGPDRYDGHLVALVAERYLLDLTADQFVRQSGVAIPPFYTEVGREFVRGEMAIGFTIGEGHEVRYGARLGDKDWLTPADGCSTGDAWRPRPQIARELLAYLGWRR